MRPQTEAANDPRLSPYATRCLPADSKICGLQRQSTAKVEIKDYRLEGSAIVSGQYSNKYYAVLLGRIVLGWTIC